MKKIYMATITPCIDIQDAYEITEISECDFSEECFDGRDDQDVLMDYVTSALEDYMDGADICEDARGATIYFESDIPSNDAGLYVFQGNDPVAMYFVVES